MIEAVHAVLHEIGADELPVELVLNKIDARRRARPEAAREPLPGRGAGLGPHRRGLDELSARIAARFADRYEPVRLLVPYDEGAELAELYALGAPIEERQDTRDGVAVRARLPRRELRRFAPYLVAEAAEPSTRRMIELPVRRLREDAVCPRAPTRATPGSTSPPASGRARAGRARARADRPRGRDPRRHAASCSRAPGSPHATESRSSTRPGLVDSGYRGELQVVLLNTDAPEPFIVEPGMRIAQLVVLAVPQRRARRGRRAAGSERGVRGFGSSAHDDGEPRIRVSALLRWQRPRSCSAGTRSRARSTGCCRAAASRRGDPRRRAAPRAAGGGRDRRRARRSRGRSRSSTRSRPQGSSRAKHVVHIVFASDLGDRSLERVTSADAAVRGHRLFSLDELDEIVLHPPIQRFLGRWQPGDPVVYLGALWAP